MRNFHLYIQQELSAPSDIVIQQDAHHYMKNVLRVKIGQQLILFNGNGFFYHSEIIDIKNKATTVNILSSAKSQNESSLSLHLGQGLSRNQRFDWVVQKATELGVSELTPLFTDNCEVKLNSKQQENKIKHWQKISQSAAEQCHRATLLTINEPLSLEKWLEKIQNAKKTLLHLNPSETKIDNQKIQSYKDKPLALAVGPIAGFTEQEQQQLMEAGGLSWQLGKRIFRTETAPIVAISILQNHIGDFQ